jgi:formylmethanofuran dehydrogenase subunit C
MIGFKAAGEEVSIITRTSVGSGEIITQGTVRFLGKEMTRNVLVEDGKVRSVLYSYACEFTVGDRVFTISQDDLREDWKEADIPEEMQDLVDKIVESFAFIGG